MNKTLKIIQKNLKMLIRTRTSAMIIIFGPLIVTILVGLSFNNTRLFNLNIGVYATGYNNMTDSFLEKLEEQQFRITKMDSEVRCIESIKQGVIHTCMVFPEKIDIESPNASNEIVFYVDYSRVNIVYTIVDTISAGIGARAEELSAGLVDVILSAVNTARGELSEQTADVTTLVQWNSEMKTKESSIQKKLDNLDLNIDRSAFKMSDLKYYDAQNREQINTVRLEINESLINCKALIINITNPTLQAELESELEDISSQMDNLNLNSSQWEKMSTLISNVESQLNATVKKMDAAKTARTEVSGDIDGIKKSLDTSMNSLVSVKGSIDSMKSGISVIKVTETSAIVSPIKTRIEPVVTKTYLNYMYPGLIVMVIMFTGILLSSTLVMSEKKSRAYFRNLITPVKDMIFVYATYITTLLILAIQLLVIILISIFYLKLELQVNLPTTLLLVFLITTLFGLIGVLIGNTFTSEETSTIAAISVSSLMLFLSSMILPLESMPVYLQEIARFNPFVVSEFLLKEAIIFHIPLDMMITEKYYTSPIPALLLLLIYSAVLFMSVILLNKLIKEHFLLKHVLGITGRQERVGPGKSAEREEMDKLIETGYKQISKREGEKAKLTYIKINELYTKLHKHDKRFYYQKIVALHKRLDRMVQETKKAKNK